jgi:type IV secretory pathway VirB2 component (pilin)
MKKTLKVLSVVLLSIAMLFVFAQPVAFARGSVENTIALTNNGNEMSGEVGTIAGTIINWIWGISIIVAIIVVMVIGIKFIIGGTQEKAEYKKTMIPYIVGAVLIFAASTIANLAYNIATSIGG